MRMRANMILCFVLFLTGSAGAAAGDGASTIAALNTAAKAQMDWDDHRKTLRWWRH